MLKRPAGWATLSAIAKATGTSAAPAMTPAAKPVAAPPGGGWLSPGKGTAANAPAAAPPGGGWLSPAARAAANATAAPAGAPQGGLNPAFGGGNFRNLNSLLGAGAAPAPAADPNAPWRPAALSQPPVSYPSLNAALGGGGGGGGGNMQTWTDTFIPRKDQMGVNTGFFPGDHAKVAAEKQAWLDEQRRTHQPPPQRRVLLNSTIGGTPGGLQAISSEFGYVPAGSGGGGGGSGGGGGGSGGGMAAANQANESRYRDILDGYQQRYERGLANLIGAGQQESKDINQRYDEQEARINNDLISRGLGNSTVKANMATGNDRERTADIGRLNERLRQEQLAVDAGLTKDVLDVMERKTDQGPDLALLAQLQRAASMGGGMGGGGGGISMGGGGGVDMVPASSLGFQNPLMWAAQAMMGGQGSIPMYGNTGGGNGFETSKERAARQGKPYFGPGNVPSFGERVALGLG
jgi:hypothetical protein